MRKSRQLTFVLSAACALVGMLHCGGGTTSGEKPPQTSPVMGVQAPEWVTRSTDYCRSQGKPGLCARGEVQGIKNYALARTTAENRARVNVQKVLEAYAAQLSKDYMASITAGDMSESDEQQMVEVANKVFTAGEQYGVQIIDFWEHPNGTLFALAHLDLDGLQDSVQKMKELGEEVKKHIRENSAKLFSKLEAEEQKHGQ